MMIQCSRITSLLFLHSQTEAWTFFLNPVDEAHVLADSTASTNHQAAHNDDVPSKEKGKKQKNETDKGKGDPVFGFFLYISCSASHSHHLPDVILTENTEVKLKELLSGLSSLALSEAEAVTVMALLREKSPNALDAWQKVRD